MNQINEIKKIIDSLGIDFEKESRDSKKEKATIKKEFNSVSMAYLYTNILIILSLFYFKYYFWAYHTVLTLLAISDTFFLIYAHKTFSAVRCINKYILYCEILIKRKKI